MRGSRRLVSLLALACLGSGFRGDGGAAFPNDPPATFTRADARWSTPLPAPSAAGVAVDGDLACTMEEPISVVCLDARTGAVRWRAALEVPDALPADEADRVRAGLAEAAAAESALRTASLAVSRLRREIRRAPGDPDVARRLAEASSRVADLEATLATWAPYRPSDPREHAGYATPTPWVDADGVVAMVGTGVVARFGRDGTRVWTRWLGHAERPMRGHPAGPTASPVRHGDRVVVGYDTLRALSVDDGATAWESVPYQDYGSPAVVEVGGAPLVVTPDGHAVDLASGAVLAEGLGDVYFTTPTVVDGDVVFVGAARQAHVDGRLTARRVRLTREGEGVGTTVVWETELPVQGRMIASPAVWNDALVVVAEAKDAGPVVLDAATGEVRQVLPDHDALHGERLGSPITGPTRLLVPASAGRMLVYGWDAGQADPTPTVAEGPATRSTPAMAGDRLVVRGVDGVWVF